MSRSKKNNSAKQTGRGAQKQSNARRQGRPARSRADIPRSSRGPSTAMVGAPAPSQQALRAYARVLTNPFSNNNVGVPYFPSVPSLKHTSRERFVFSTGTSIGWFTAVPVWANDAGLRNSGTTDNFGTPTGIASTGFPYSSAALGSRIRGRIVACGLRIRNITAMLNRGGTAYVFREPDGNGLIAQALSLNAVAMWAAQGCWHTADANGEWSGVHYVKTDPTDYDYQPNAGPSKTGDCLGVYISAPSTVQTYEVEMVTHVEYIGTASGGLLLPGVTESSISVHVPVLESHATKVLAKSTSGANANHPTTMGTLLADAAAAGREVTQYVGQGVRDVRSIAGSVRGLMSMLAA